MPAVAIALLGPLRVDGAAAALSPRDRMVLAALAVREEVMAADQLAAAVWGDELPGSWLKQVHICVMHVRKALGPDAIETTAGGYRLALTGDELDTHRFEGLVERGRVLVADGEPDRAASTLARALALWRGEPFEDLDPWPPSRAEAARLAELRRSAQEDLLEARLACGEHRAVAAEAEVLVADEPLRERRWAVLALAQYRSGRQADALRSLNRARRALVDELGIDPGPELVALEAAILRQDPSLLAVAEPTAISDDCPYKGLAAYDEADIDSFFGRDVDLAACLARLEASRLLAVSGPSGCGKSSLVRAGLVPALRHRQRAVAVLVPGADPDGSLSDALASLGESADPVLVIDQFEDLFTLGASAETVDTFCARLVAYAEERAPVVVVVRSDHLAALGAEPRLARLVEQGLHLTGPLRGEALRAAIEGPAQQAGLRLEPGLVDLLVRDTEDEPGALPLLSHALVETWRRRDGRLLTVEGYRATGGIRGAVARSADRLYQSLPADQRSILRSVVLRLVMPVRDGEPVRSRIASRSLGGDPVRERVLGLLVRARLVIAEEDTVELAHEALARAWPRLRAWLDDDATGQRTLRHLAATAEGWDGLGRPADELYRGARLDAALEWRESTHPDLTAVEVAFLDASAAAATAEQQAAAARARHQARQNRRLRALLTATASLLVVALVAGLVAVNRTGDARQQRDAAQVAQQEADLEALVNRSLALRPTNRSVAALLAVEAYRRRPDARAWSALLGTFQGTPGFMGYRYLPAEFYATGALVPGTSTAVIALDGRDLKLLDLEGGELEDPFPAPTDIPATPPVMRVSGNGRFVALYHGVDSRDPCYDLGYLRATDGRGCSALSVYALDSGRRVLGPVTPPFSVGDVALDHDGSLVAVSGGYDGDVAVYRTVDGQLTGTVPGIPRPDGAVSVEQTAALAFVPDGRLVVGSMAGAVRVVEPTTARVVDTFDAPPSSSNVRLALLPSGLLVAAGSETLVAIEPSTGATRWSTDGHTGSEFEPCSGLALAVATGRFYCASRGGVLEERDLATGQRTGMRWEGQLGGLSDMAATSDGRELVVFAGPAISRWRVDGSGPVTTRVAQGRVVMDGFDPTGSALLVARRDGLAVGSTDMPDYAVWDPATDRVVDPIDEDLFAAIWAGPDLLAVVYADGTSGYYDVAARRRVELGDIPDLRVPVSRAWLSAGGSRLYVSRVTDTGCEIWTYDPATRTRVDPTIDLEDGCYYVRSLSATPDGELVVVSANVLAEANIAGERSGQVVTSLHDGTTGEQMDQRLPESPEFSEVAVSDDLLVGSAPGGDMTVHDLPTVRPLGQLPGGRAPARSLTFSGDGTVLLAASRDDNVSLYDVATRTRIGEPIPARSPNPDLTPGFLRPDGGAVAVTDRSGVAVWDLAPDRLADAACQLAGRNLTRAEWDSYVGGLWEYRATCPEYR